MDVRSNNALEDVYKLRLHFDGMCNPNPGNGACAAITYGSAGSLNQLNTMWSESKRLGDSCTDNRAEYMGLIVGLRLILRQISTWIKPSLIEVNVFSDAELIIKQMQRVAPVSHLVVLFRLAQNLCGRFRKVTFDYIGSNQNQAAKKLAQEALSESLNGYTFFEHLTYYPNVRNVQQCYVGDMKFKCMASHDAGSSGANYPHCFIDAHFLSTAAPQELERLEDPCPFTFVSGKSSFRILGIITSPLLVNFKSVDFHIRNIVVVDYLPVPLHISLRHADVESYIGTSSFTFNFDKLELIAENFPEYYRAHPYWKSKNNFDGENIIRYGRNLGFMP